MSHASNLTTILSQKHPDRLSIALAYGQLGICVIPIPANTKKARCKWKKWQSNRPDESQLRRWFGNNNKGSIAIMLGEVSGGLVCRDFDCMDAYQLWATEFPQLAKSLPTVETARAYHVYAKASVEQIQSFGKAWIEFEDGEFRLQNCYCLAPPSIHPDGKIYRFSIPFGDDVPVIDLDSSGFLNEYVDATESNGEHRDNREDRGQQKNTETTESIPNDSVDSAALCCTEFLTFPESVQEAIVESLPSGPGKRNHQVFELARALKAIPSLTDAEAKELKAYVRSWHKLAIPTIQTKPFEETWIDFLRGWQKVKFPKGSEPIRLAFEAAKAEPPPIEAEEFEQPELRLLVSLCRELQRLAGDGVFFLDCRTAARLLRVEHTKAWRWLSVLLPAEGVLEITERGSQAKHRANRYRYLLDLE